ncbi:protein kinase [Actinoplanes sp. NPDC051343]|uniref:protein kinase domain-containing protein n=1 Tax=Actinoplanes sp. NPDC051343 TaxID=3363906 RepID=UPI0037A0EA0B
MSSDWPVASALMAGRYRLVSLLETGGMAEIWRAEDELLDRPVAVKLPTGPQVVWREARMAARLSHPGIAAVHDYREAVRPDGTVVPFVVMELLTGESVAARVDRELIGWAEAAHIGAAVADALAAAHASGVVHRDIKPGNVMLTPNGVKILDFGISVAAGEPDDDDTGATFGTPAYVAPERLDGMPAEPATDVYGVGVLLFEMVTGDPPYPVETWEELAAARVNGPSELPQSLPADFRDVVDRCLDADPAGRPTAARLRADLLAVALRSRPPAPAAAAVVPAADRAVSLAVSPAAGPTVSPAAGPTVSQAAWPEAANDGRDLGGKNGVPAPRAGENDDHAFWAGRNSDNASQAGQNGSNTPQTGENGGNIPEAGETDEHASRAVGNGSNASRAGQNGGHASHAEEKDEHASRAGGDGGNASRAGQNGGHASRAGENGGDASQVRGNGGNTSRAGASGSVGNLVRAAGVSADQWVAAASAGAAEGQGGPARQFGTGGGRPGPAAGLGAAEAPGAADVRGGLPGYAGVGEAGLGGSAAGQDTPTGARVGGAAAGGSSRRRGGYDGAGERVARSSGGAGRSSFAYTDSDEAQGWRPGGRGAGGGVLRPGSGPPGVRRPGGTRDFATGRASAATLDMAGAPRRRTAFGIGAAVVLAALAGAFAVLTWTHRDADRDVAVPPAATASALPGVTATTAAPTTTTAAATSGRPSPKASLSFEDAVSRMRDAVEGGEASGQIRGDVAQDLLNLLGPLSNAQGSDLTGQVQALRKKIQIRVGEDGITQARAAVLQSRLEDLDRAAGT